MGITVDLGQEAINIMNKACDERGLDPYDTSLLGWCHEHDNYTLAGWCPLCLPDLSDEQLKQRVNDQLNEET